MLSRRSVRIKVMQLLFSLNRDHDLNIKTAQKRYWEAIDATYALYLYSLFLLIQIAKLAIEDKTKRKSKHLPSDLDKAFTTKLYTNELVQSLVQNSKLQRKFEELKFNSKLNPDYYRNIYLEFAKSENYQKYIVTESDHKVHKEILLDMYRFCRKNEFFNEILEDHFPNWIDDKSVVIGAIKKSIKQFPAKKEEFFENFFPDKEATDEFGNTLFNLTYESDEELLEFIKPALKNWDHERLAIIDMILIKMAISEFIHFKTIPTKVTLNEYVEISKLYSTAKSKDFINGILDRLLKELEKDGKITKAGRGLVN